MAGTATHLHTVPTPAPVAVRRRGNHPAGRALAAPSRPAVDARVERPVVVPLRPALAEVVPLPARAARPDRQQVPGPVRLTRRGRRVVAGLGVGAALALAAVVGGAALDSSAGPALELAGRSTVTVHSGDTLWSIAVAVAPDTDPREVVDALQEVNDLTGAALVPGQVLLLP
ncbi:LysM domain-containing protein [Klenkia marina]|uniref:LysM domain-containing protein n=1 Tax=Klenkia marina TaxID=1960309 RepID=A0A1G4Z2H2_9ACTN|nr:LysM peptidoglycan-binding domain-containing protein [Klenkia marina]SCX59822.1 LysM domain-containing protein [Klenkia marina]